MLGTLYTDGASKGNPGVSGIGIVLQYKSKNGQELTREYSKNIGIKTNNEAEYDALIYGIERAKQFGIDHLRCFADSELMIKQLNGLYKVQNQKLIERFIKIWNLKISFKKVTFIHISRNKNTRADALSKHNIKDQFQF